MDLKNASAALILCGLAACGGTTKSTPGSTLPPGSVAPNPGTGNLFVVDLNEGGNANQLQLVGQPLWGRLVDIYAPAPITGLSKLYFTDFLIGQEIQSDGVDFTLERNPVSSKETLTILHTFDTALYLAAFGRLEGGLQSFLDKGLDPNELPPFTALPRNAAMMIRFNDLLADGGNPGSNSYPGKVIPTNVQLAIGYPPVAVAGARVIPDPNHGDIVDGVFHSTRVLIDMSVSQAEAISAGVLPNAIGLPEAVSVTKPNVVVRIPTQLNAGAVQFEVLTNLAGSNLGFASSGSSDPFSPTLDVVRAFRSGGRTVTTGDPFNGFLRDNDPPRVLGAQAVTVTFVATVGTEFLVDMQYSTVACATQPRPGDMLVLPGVVAEVTQLAGVPAGGAVASVQMKLIAGQAATFVPGPGSFRMPWDITLGVQPECFVRFSPEAGQLPDLLVSNDASVVVSFSEPVFPRSANGFSGMQIGYVPAPTSSMMSHVVGGTTTNQDLTEVTFDPSAKLNHTNGTSESFTFDLAAGAAGVVDLAGNALASTLPQTTFSLNALEPTSLSGSIAFTFSNPSLDENGDGIADVRGQLIVLPGIGEITTRSVSRFSAVVDDSQVSVLAMSSLFPPFFLFPVVTTVPLTPHGARLQAAWRHVDMGLTTIDLEVVPIPADPANATVVINGWEDSLFNLDVEGLAWSPFAAGLSGDFFPELQLSLTHSHFAPDEGLVIAGLAPPFAGNSLANHPPQIVHQKSEGYVVQNLDLFQASTGTFMAPWPMNRNKPIEDYSYFTYRDTTVQEVAGPGGTGGDPAIWSTVPDPLPATMAVLGQRIYPPGAVPTICLPLLMDFRIYPSNAVGLNLMAGKVDLFGPVGSTTFRAYSAGYSSAAGPPVTVNPDQETQAAGTLVGGLPSAPIDDMLTLGQADFVVRMNQVHSIWVNAGTTSNWKAAVFDPPVLEQPNGTSVSIAFRGATSVGAGGSVSTLMDPYGDPVDVMAMGAPSFAVTYLNGDSSWKTDLNDLSGAQFIQMRITMIANVDSGVTPALSAVGVSFEN